MQGTNFVLHNNFFSRVILDCHTLYTDPP